VCVRACRLKVSPLLFVCLFVCLFFANFEKTGGEGRRKEHLFIV